MSCKEMRTPQHSAIHKRMPSILEINLYRVIQEAVHNALKYSHAEEIKVELQTKKDYLVLAIIDNGIGFDPAAANRGLGLKHMEERTRPWKITKPISCRSFNSKPNTN